jgi:hypothetical protein
LAAICEDGRITRKLIFELPKSWARFIWMKLGHNGGISWKRQSAFEINKKIAGYFLTGTVSTVKAKPCLLRLGA